MKILKDIRFWILLFFVLRLYGITNPPLDIAHNWRQVTGDMVSRNFYEVDNNIFYPRLDFAGERTGITGTEFSTLNYLTYLLSLLFGFHDWFARLINLLISSIGIFYFYKVIKLKFDERLAFLAAYLLLISDWLIYSRKAMPDTFSVALVIMSLYYSFRYFENYKLKNLIAYFLLAMIGVLSKIPAAYLLALLIIPLRDKDKPKQVKITFVLASILMLIPVCIWYYMWVPYLIVKYKFAHYYMGVSIQLGFRQLLASLALVFERFYYDALKFTGFAAYLTGLFIAFRRNDKVMLKIIAITGFAFFVFMMKSGSNFSAHSYYIIPFVPVMCLFAAYAIFHLKNKTILLVLLLILTAENIANQQHDFIIKKSERYKLSLESIADRYTKRNDLVVINCGINPQELYLMHRKGWIVSTEQAHDLRFLDSLVKKKCKVLFLDKHLLKGNEPAYPNTPWFQDENFIVYLLSR
ncbi:MAG TPA: glycosyltransferase family 39 protein [Bacteroidia bacterium]|nr:glycosyltransferase family 39 protein [Bacteroidia bacterium]